MPNVLLERQQPADSNQGLHYVKQITFLKGTQKSSSIFDCFLLYPNQMYSVRTARCQQAVSVTVRKKKLFLAQLITFKGTVKWQGKGA